MILSVPEYDTEPVEGVENDLYYNRVDNKVYICTQAGPPYGPVWEVWCDPNAVPAVRADQARLPDQFAVRDTLTRTSFLGRDWNSFVNELRSRLVAVLGNDYGDFFESDMGMMLIDLMAYGLDSLAWYQDKWASEMFLDTAKLRQSIVRIARMLGYQPSGLTAARIRFDFSLAKTYAFPVVIPAGFEVAAGEIVFATDSAITILAGATTPAEIENTDGTEGAVRYKSASASGEAWQRLELPVDSTKLGIAYQSIQVYVGGVLWTETNFWGYGPSNEYRVYYDEETPYILFGDGVTSNVPTADSTINVTYRLCSGKAGNVASGKATKVVAPLVINGTSIRLNVTNSERAKGGIDVETDEHIRTWAPRILWAQDRAVSVGDYETLVLTFSDPLGQITRVKGVVERGVDDDAYLTGLLNQLKALDTSLYDVLKGYIDGLMNSGYAANVLSLFLLSQDEDGLYTSPPVEYINPDPAINPLLAYLNDRKGATVNLVLNDGTVYIRYCTVAIEVKILTGYTKSEVIAAVNTAIQTNRFAEMDFGDALRLSDCYAITEAVEGVGYAHVTLTPVSGSGGEGITRTDKGDLVVPAYLLIQPRTITITEIEE